MSWNRRSRAVSALLAVCLTASSLLVFAAEAQNFAWPNDATAAVSLAYDDALASQLDHALPSLDERGLKATFYLTLASETLNSRMEEWRQAASRGHELGNHTVYHPCSASLPGREWVADVRNLDQIPVEAMLQEVEVANAYLKALDGRDQRTFTPPCLDRLASGEDYVEMVASRFVAIKGPGDLPIADPALVDLLAVPTAFPAEVTGEYLINQVKAAALTGGLISLTFHGVGGDHLVVSRQAHDELLDFLAANRESYWTDTFLNIMLFVKAQREPPEPE